MQTYLEQEAIKKREELDILKDYNKDNQYGPNHPDAISDGDAQGKGTNSGGHGFGIRQGYYPASTWIDRFYEWLNNLQ